MTCSLIKGNFYAITKMGELFEVELQNEKVIYDKQIFSNTPKHLFIKGFEEFLSNSVHWVLLVVYDIDENGEFYLMPTINSINADDYLLDNSKEYFKYY